MKRLRTLSPLERKTALVLLDSTDAMVVAVSPAAQLPRPLAREKPTWQRHWSGSVELCTHAVIRVACGPHDWRGAQDRPAAMRQYPNRQGMVLSSSVGLPGGRGNPARGVETVVTRAG